MACFYAKLYDFLCATAPLFNKTPSIKNICDEGITRLRLMIFFQVFWAQIKRQCSIAPNLEPIIKESNTDRAAGSLVCSITIDLQNFSVQ